DSSTVLATRAEDFLAGLEPLISARVLSGVLVQFPLSFAWSSAARTRLERLAASLARVPLVLEVRHRSWFERDPLEWIEHLGYSLARIDLPASDSHPPADPPALGPLAYVRLHGRNSGAWFAREA